MKRNLKLISFSNVDKIEVHGQISIGHGHLKCLFKFKDPSHQIAFYDFPKKNRMDDLWKETCLEAFIYQPATKQYLELNLSPKNGAWNAYLFESYRKRSKIQPQWTQLKMLKNGMGFRVPLNEIEKLLGPPPFQMAISCVVKSQNETHYFALAHLDQVPNFHYSPSYIEPLKY